ncbi:MAG: class I SAM-dependent methyltransferase [Nanoarchaeota archaeon]
MTRMRKEYEEIYQNYENKLFYFVAREDLILKLIRSHFGNRTMNVLDLGCGTGNVLEYLSEHLKGNFTGLDASPIMLKNKTSSKVKLVRGDIYHPKLKPESFDVILCLDVIEHLKDDLGALKTINKLLRKNGVAIVLVPAFPHLWNQHDILNQHYRRYTRDELKRKIGLIPGKKRIFYWNFVSYFPKVGSKLQFLRWVTRYVFRNKGSKKEASDIEAFLLPEPFNTFIAWWLYLENKWISLGLPLPFGSSLVAVIRKN